MRRGVIAKHAGSILVGVVTAVLTALITLYFLTERADLTARVMYGRLEIPPVVEVELKKLQESRDSFRGSIEAIHKDLQKPAVSAVDADEKAADVVKGSNEARALIQQHLALALEKHPRQITETFKSMSGHVSGFWNVQIENSGNRKAIGVRLFVPNAQVASVYNEKNLSVNVPGEGDGIMEIGDIPPSGVVRVDCWSKTDPSRWAAKRVRLLHDSGEGSVELVHHVGGVWAWFDEWWPLVLMAVVAMGWVVMKATETTSEPLEVKPTDSVGEVKSNAPVGGGSS